MHLPFFIWCAISHPPPFELLPWPPPPCLHFRSFWSVLHMASTVIFVKRNLIMSSHAYKPSVASLCTVAEIKRIYPGLRGWAWHSPDLPFQLSLSPIPSLSLSFPPWLFSFSSLMRQAVSCLSVFSLFPLPWMLLSMLHLAHSFLGFLLIVTFSWEVFHIAQSKVALP